MDVQLKIPDDVARVIQNQQPDLSRAALEALALEGYRSERLSEGQVCRMLGFGTRMQVHTFLKARGPWNPDAGSPREGPKRLKTIAWVYWKISSTPFLVDGVSWSSLAGAALRSAQVVALWPSGSQSEWDPAAKWWRRT